MANDLIRKRLEQRAGSAATPPGAAAGPTGRTGGAGRPGSGLDTATILDRIRQRLAAQVPEELIRTYRTDSRAREQLTRLIQRLVREEGGTLGRVGVAGLTEQLLADLLGYGPIQPLVDDPDVTEIMVNGPDQVWVERAGRLEAAPVQFRDTEHLRQTVERIVAAVGRRIDESTPLQDARLPDGSRVNAVLPPVALDGPYLTIRKFTRRLTAQELVEKGALSEEVLGFLSAAVRARFNIIVSGGTGSGKCVTGDTPILLSDGTLIPIAQLVEGDLRETPVLVDRDGWVSAPARFFVLSWDPLSGQLRPATVTRVWQGPVPDLVEVATASGRRIVTSTRHPFPILRASGQVSWVAAGDMEPGMRVAVPRRLPIEGEPGRDLWGYLKELPGVYVVGCKELVRRWKNGPGLTILDYRGHLGVEKGDIRQWAVTGVIPWKAYRKMMEDLGRVRPDAAYIQVKGKTARDAANIPLNLSSDLMAWYGMVLADGSLETNAVYFHKEDPALLEQFADLTQRLFGLPVRIKKYRNRCTRAAVFSAPLVAYIRAVFRLNGKQKSRTATPPAWLPGIGEEELRSWLSAVFSCDGSVSERGVELVTASEQAADTIHVSLLRLGIGARRKTKIVPKYPHRTYHRFIIAGKAELEAFARNIRWMSRAKEETFRALLSQTSKPHSNVDLIPFAGRLLQEQRLRLGMTTRQMATALGVTRRAVSFYENNERAMSRVVAAGVAALVPLPDMLVSEDVLWDRITEIRPVDSSGHRYVYDLTVEGTHTFVAGHGPMIAHNTTLLNALSSFIPHDERIVTIEDAAELRLQQPHVVRLETRPANVEGRGEIPIRQLVRNALRMRPDRIVVGEVRGGEALDMLQAMNTGHEGSLSTLHANSPRDALRRLEVMVLMAGEELPLRAIREQIASAVDLIVQIARLRDGSRRVVSISQVLDTIDEAGLRAQELFRFEHVGEDDQGRIAGGLVPTGAELAAYLMERMAARGVAVPGTAEPGSGETEAG